MSKVSQALRDVATSLNVEADTLFKSVDWELTKQATLNSLVENGVASETAVKILDGLECKVVPEKAETLEKVATLRDQSNIFSVTADYLEDIESKLSISKARVTELEKQASMKPVVSSLKDVAGFNDDDIDELNSLPEGLLNKIASLRSDETPSGLGKVSSRMSTAVDPMMEFLIN